MNKPFPFLLILLLIVTGSKAQNSFVSPQDKRIRYEGRIGFKGNAAELSWPGTSITVWFNGTGVSALLQDSDTANYYNVIVDDTAIIKIHTDTAKRSYTLAQNLPKGRHMVQLFKRTEWERQNMVLRF